MPYKCSTVNPDVDVQIEDASVGRGEPAGGDVERRQIGVEVDVQRLAAGGPSAVGGSSDERRAHCLAACPISDHHVLDPGVHETVPHDVDEAHQGHGSV